MEPWQTIMLVGGIAIVCSAVLPRRRAAIGGQQDSDNQTVRNMETALEQFMENMEADNRDIASLVSKSSQEAQEQATMRDERIEQLEKRCTELEQALAEQVKRVAAIVGTPQAVTINNASPSMFTEPLAQPIMTQVETTAEIIEEEQSAPTIRIRYAELFEMHQAGKSIDAIAKKLGRNKGEVQLILQLSRQEEAARHE